MRALSCSAVLAALVLVHTAGFAQERGADSADVLVLSHDFVAGSGEFVRVFLQKGVVYRAEINLGNVGFTVRPRHPGGEPPIIALVRGGTTASGEAVFEIYPFKDDEYEIKVLDVPAGESGSLRLYRDIAASRRRQGVAKTGGGTSIGIELAIGYHGNYRVSESEDFFGTNRSGTDIEGCISIRSRSRGWGCFLGVTRHAADSGPTILWFFVEPRFRLVGGEPQSKLELGILLRGGFGSADEKNQDPFSPTTVDNPAFIGPGGYLRYWLGPIPGKGLSLSVSMFEGFILGGKSTKGSFNHIGGGVSFHF